MQAARRSELVRAGHSRRGARRTFDRVTRCFYAHRGLRDASVAEAQRFTQFREAGPVVHSMRQRVQFHALENPHAVMTGWAALRLFGLQFWADCAPVTLASAYKGCRARRTRLPVVREEHPVEAFESLRSWRVDDVPVRTVNWSFALVSALKDVLRGRCTWLVVEIPGLSAREVRAIQLVSAVRRLDAVDWSSELLFRAAHGRICRRMLRRILFHSDAHSDSPPETLLNVLVRSSRLLPVGRWEGQVPIFDGGSLDSRGKTRWDVVARPDLMCRELKIALFYDGSVHRDQEVFARDARIVGELQANGWMVLRVTWPMLRNSYQLVLTVRSMVAQQMMRRSAALARRG